MTVHCNMLATDLLTLLQNALPTLGEALGFRATETLEIGFLAQGEYNINFLLQGAEQRYVLRYNTGSQIGKAGNAQLEYEAMALKRIGLSGVSPRFITLLTEPVPLLVMEYLPGEPLNYRNPEHITAAARTLAKLHQIGLEPGDTFIHRVPCIDDVREAQSWLAPYFSCERASAPVRQRLKEILQSATLSAEYDATLFPPTAHLAHTDVQAHNFIVHESKESGANATILSCRLVDWERPLKDDLTYDLAHFLIRTTTQWKCDYTFSREEKEAFLNAYLTARPELNPGEIRHRLHVRQRYIALRAISWCAGAWVEYTQGNRAITHTQTLSKIEEYLQLDALDQLFDIEKPINI